MAAPTHKTPGLADQAAHWLARLDGPGVTEADRAAFEAWRAADPRHDAAYTRLEIGWQQFDRLRAARPPRGAPDPQLFSSAVAVDRFVTVKRFSLAASVLVAVAAAGYFLLHETVTDRTYSTAVGEYQRIVLADQSVIELNTATKLRVHLDPQLRRVDLQQGEARFTVAHDSARPFVVEAGQTAVRAVGTAFTVRRKLREIEVIVTEGKVAVASAQKLLSAPAATLAAAPAVTAGERAISRTEGLEVRRITAEETKRAGAWQDGMLAFDGETLGAVVEEFNRYNAIQLSVADPRVAALRIGGYFRATGLDAFTATLKRSFGIEVERIESTELRLVLPAPGGS